MVVGPGNIFIGNEAPSASASQSAVNEAVAVATAERLGLELDQLRAAHAQELQRMTALVQQDWSKTRPGPDAQQRTTKIMKPKWRDGGIDRKISRHYDIPRLGFRLLHKESTNLCRRGSIPLWVLPSAFTIFSFLTQGPPPPPPPTKMFFLSPGRLKI